MKNKFKILKNRKFIIKSLLVIFLLYLVVDYQIDKSREAYFYDELAKKYKNNEQKFPLKDLTNFKWDNVKAYTPYSPSEEETYLKFYLNNVEVAKIRGLQSSFQKKVTGEEYSYIWFFDSRFKEKYPDFLIRKVSFFDYFLNEFSGSIITDYEAQDWRSYNSLNLFVSTKYEQNNVSKLYYFYINN